MEYRKLGRTGLEVSVLGFGCGAVGGLLIKGDPNSMMRVVARAIASGITYFDTARSYGNGQSEISLGRILEELDADVMVGTKVDLHAEEMDDIEEAIIESVEGSLKRLRRERVELIQLHNPIAARRQPERGRVSVEDMQVAMQAFERLREQGKVRHWGITGVGETTALHQAIETGRAGAVQSPFNLINPTAGVRAPEGFPLQDYRQLIDKAADQRMGVIAIRVLAAGALSGSTDRHPNAAQDVTPIGSSESFAKDVALARRFSFLVEDGYVSSLVEAAIRFVISKAEVSTALVGISNMTQLEQAIEFANKGPLPAEALDKLRDVWASYAATG